MTLNHPNGSVLLGVGVDRARGTNLRDTDISMGTVKSQDWRPAKRKRRYSGVQL